MTKLSNLDIFGERKVSPVLSIIMLRHLHKQNHRNHPRRIEKNTGNLHFFSHSFSFIPSSASLEYIYSKRYIQSSASPGKFGLDKSIICHNHVA